MHANEMVHRDLKLENVIVTDKDKLHVKLGDFGMSRFDTDGGLFDTACGTIIYCKSYSFALLSLCYSYCFKTLGAPERLHVSDTSKGGKICYNKSVDVWSLGVMLYAALAHSMPFNGTYSFLLFLLLVLTLLLIQPMTLIVQKVEGLWRTG